MAKKSKIIKTVKKLKSSSSSIGKASQLLSQLKKPAVASNSGNTAVALGGTLQKVGKVIGDVSNIASKFLPGIGGTIAKGLANVFNDPEWWNNIEGDGITTNEPLRTVALGKFLGLTNKNAFHNRPALAEVTSLNPVISISPTMATNYLIPYIRKVVNAVPLQDANDYASILANNATIYALYQQLKKFRYMLEHGVTYMPNTNDVAFPILQVINAPQLDAYIRRLEEYLRSNVRLPHTLCEYLAWRFGRVYKTNRSGKSGIIMYNVLSVSDSITTYDNTINTLLGYASTTPALQKSQSDLYNVYLNHNMAVEIRNDTQFKFDYKEFMLRINLDFADSVGSYGDMSSGSFTPGIDLSTELNPVVIDSELDNRTVFMASVVSTKGSASSLFPVDMLKFYSYCVNTRDHQIFGSDWSAAVNSSTNWRVKNHAPCCWYTTAAPTVGSVVNLLSALMCCAAMDIYNAQIYIAMNSDDYTDLTALDIDMGTISDTVVDNEHIYAFANLTNLTRVRSESYQEAEKEVTKDVANMIDELTIVTR